MKWAAALVTLLAVSALADVRFFVHVPKTGGTTFRHIFARDCPHVWTFLANAPGTVADAPLVRNLMLFDNYTCFQGHMEWGLVEKLRSEFNITTFVLLRDPASRLISQYYYEQALHNRSYLAEDFFLQHANVVSQYLGADSVNVIRERATHIGITERYHETLSYLVAVGFLRNRIDVVRYNARKVYQREPSPQVVELAATFTAHDRDVYDAAMIRFDHQLASLNDNDVYATTLDELNSFDHDCQDDESGIGSGKCW